MEDLEETAEAETLLRSMVQLLRITDLQDDLSPPAGRAWLGEHAPREQEISSSAIEHRPDALTAGGALYLRTTKSA